MEQAGRGVGQGVADGARIAAQTDAHSAAQDIVAAVGWLAAAGAAR